MTFYLDSVTLYLLLVHKVQSSEVSTVCLNLLYNDVYNIGTEGTIFTYQGKWISFIISIFDLSSIDHELSEIDSSDKLHFPIILKHFVEIISLRSGCFVLYYLAGNTNVKL